MQKFAIVVERFRDANLYKWSEVFLFTTLECFVTCAADTHRHTHRTTQSMIIKNIRVVIRHEHRRNIQQFKLQNRDRECASASTLM